MYVKSATESILHVVCVCVCVCINRIGTDQSLPLLQSKIRRKFERPMVCPIPSILATPLEGVCRRATPPTSTLPTSARPELGSPLSSAAPRPRTFEPQLEGAVRCARTRCIGFPFRAVTRRPERASRPRRIVRSRLLVASSVTTQAHRHAPSPTNHISAPPSLLPAVPICGSWDARRVVR